MKEDKGHEFHSPCNYTGVNSQNHYGSCKGRKKRCLTQYHQLCCVQTYNALGKEHRDCLCRGT